MKRHGGFIFRLLFTVALLVWLFHDLPLRSQLASPLPIPTNAFWLVVAWFVAGLGEVASLLRFWCCLHLAGIPLPIRRAASLHFAGLFTSLFLPGMAGGDALKIALLAMQFPQRKFGGVLAVLMDRLSGFVVIILWTMLLAWMRADWFGQNSIAAGALFTILITAGPTVGALLIWFLINRTHSMRTRIQRLPFRGRLLQFEACFNAIAADRSRTLTVILASIAGFVAYFLLFHFSALAYDMPIAWRDTFAVMPLIDLISTLPITIAGLGLREQAFQAIMAPLCGLTSSQSVVVSLTGFFVGSTWGLLGAPIFLWLRPLLKTAPANA